MTPPRLAFQRTSLEDYYRATWGGAGPHDKAVVHRQGGLSPEHPQWRWQVTIGMKTSDGHEATKQEAADRANEVWRERVTIT